MSETRLSLGMNVLDGLMTMAGGNPGAMRVLSELIFLGKEIDPDSAFGAFGTIMGLDTCEIYEERIWMLFKDVCGEDISQFVAVIRAWQLGHISREALNTAIDNRGEGLELDRLRMKVELELPNFQKKESCC